MMNWEFQVPGPYGVQRLYGPRGTEIRLDLQAHEPVPWGAREAHRVQLWRERQEFGFSRGELSLPESSVLGGGSP